MFNTGLIDSLKIRVKLDKVKILDKRLITDFIAYYPTIEALDDDGNEQEKLGDSMRKAEPFVKIIDGITYRFYIKAFIDKNKLAHEYVVFQISAKMLKQKYFEGITAKNIDMIIDGINSFAVLKVSKKDFLEGLVSDIDICINQLIDIKSLKTAFAFIQQNPNKGKLPLMHFINQSNQLKNTVNLGVDFNKREKATNTAPYCKIYHKGFELQSKSSVFYTKFLAPMKASVLDNLVRYEFTVKAHKHKEFLVKKGFLADFKTLNDLLATKPNDLKLIAQTGLKHYIEEQPRTRANKELSPTDLQIQSLMEIIINMGGEEDKLFRYLYMIEDPSTKSRSKARTKKLLDDLKNRDRNLKEKLEINNNTYQFLANLGL